MKTIKIIDLLKNYADGKEMPRLIRYQGDKYTFNSSVTFPHSYIGEDDELFTRGQIYLNEEVEILDEEEKEDTFTGIKFFQGGECVMSILNEPLIPVEDEFEDIKEIGVDEISNLDLAESFDFLEEKLNQLIKNQKKIIDKLNKE